MKKLLLAATLLLVSTSIFARCDYLRVIQPQFGDTVENRFWTKAIIGTKPGNWSVYLNGWPVKQCQNLSSGQKCHMDIRWAKPKWVEGPNGWEQWYSIQYFTQNGFCGEDMNTGNPVPTGNGTLLQNHYQRIEVKADRPPIVVD